MITYRKEKSKKSEITSIKRGTKIYGAVNTLLEGMPKQKLEMRMPYWQELNNVLNALLLAYGLVDDEKIKEEYHFLNMIDFDNDDMLWTLNLAHMLKRRWEEKQPLKGKPNAKMCLTNGKRDVTISVVDLIKYMEEENRQFWEDNPEMAYKTGMQFRPDI